MIAINCYYQLRFSNNIRALKFLKFLNPKQTLFNTFILLIGIPNSVLAASEICDVISFGDMKTLYYCFPKQKPNVCKVRYAAEELYKINNK